MEELGIGRPSTYTAILKTLEDRDYVTIDKRRLVPQAKGRLLSAFLESFFERYVEYDFTAALEEKLDEISDGKLAWKDVLRDFWKDFSGRRRRHQGAARHRRARRAERRAGAAGVPGARGRLQSAHLPEMRHRQSVAEARQIRRLRRLLELSGMQLHPPARRRRQRQWRGRVGDDGDQGARQGPLHRRRRSR